MHVKNRNQLPHGCFYQQLQNGLEIIGQYLPGRRSIACGFHIDIGIASEPDEKQGLTAIIEQICCQGAIKRKKELEGCEGVQLEISPEMERMMVYTNSVDTKFAASLQLLKATFLAPTLDTVALEEPRLIVKQKILRRLDSPASRLIDGATVAFFHGTTLTRSPIGTIEGIENIKYPDISSFWVQHYQPDNSFFAIAGNFVWDEVVEQVRSLFEEWNGQATLPLVQHPIPRKRTVAIHQMSQQEHLCFMFPLPHYNSADSYGTMILRGLLKRRLFDALRGQRNLAYRIAIDLVNTRYLNYMRIYIGTLPKYAPECVKIVLDTLQQLEKKCLAIDELELAKVKMKSENIFWSESTKNRLISITRSWWHEHNFRTIEDIKRAVDAVTTEQIFSILQRFPPLSALTLAVLGPVDPATVWRDMAA